MPTLSLVTPAYNEASNLPALHGRIVQALGALGVDWEWVIVDDHSVDATFGTIEHLAAVDPRVRGVRLARNSGSHMAITCGLHVVAGDCAVILAADLQDPPEMLGAMLERWRDGAQVVWAVRRKRPGEPSHASFAAVYYWIVRRVMGMKEVPSRGSDFFLIDRPAIEAFRQFDERNVSVFLRVSSLGFRQDYIEYDKQPRASGRSGWTLSRKIQLVIDTVTGFSHFPVRLCSYGGLALIAAGLAAAVAGVFLLPSLGGGLLLLMAAVVGIGGVQLLAIGMMGEYLWRALDEARRRPRWIVERATAAYRSTPDRPKESDRIDSPRRTAQFDAPRQFDSETR